MLYVCVFVILWTYVKPFITFLMHCVTCSHFIFISDLLWGDICNVINIATASDYYDLYMCKSGEKAFEKCLYSIGVCSNSFSSVKVLAEWTLLRTASHRCENRNSIIKMCWWWSIIMLDHVNTKCSVWFPTDCCRFCLWCILVLKKHKLLFYRSVSAYATWYY
jgi:hypothetical protein